MPILCTTELSGDQRTRGRSAPGAKAAGAQAGPHPYPGRRPTEAARVVAGPAEVVPVAGLAVAGLAGIAGRAAGIPAVVVAPASLWHASDDVDHVRTSIEAINRLAFKVRVMMYTPGDPALAQKSHSPCATRPCISPADILIRPIFEI